MYRILFSIFLITGLLTTSFWCPPVSASGNQELWEKVMKAQSDGLPKTAIEQLDAIMLAAREDDDPVEALKALSLKISLEANIEGNSPAVKVARMQAEIKAAPPRLKSVYQAVLALWFWHYYQNNQWRFADRSTTAGVDDDDFTTWDLPKLFKEVDSLFQAALEPAEMLQNTPLENLRSFLRTGDAPAELRPTYYDFLAHQALAFYTSADQSIAAPQDAFEMDGNGPCLDDEKVFITWNPETTDTASPLYKAVKIYQSLLRFHRKAENLRALADADLHRLRFARLKSFGPDRPTRVMARYAELIETYRELPEASMAAYERARELQTAGQLVEAHAQATAGRDLHPDSRGGGNCQSLIDQIELPTLSVTGERTLSPDGGKLQLQYRNITGAYVRIIRDDWNRFMSSAWESPDSYNWDRVDSFLNKKPVAQFKVDLKPTPDYQERGQQTDIPALQPGYYRMIVSHRADFSRTDNKIISHPFWVTRLALVVKDGNGPIMEGLVLNAASGEPEADVKVRVYQRNQEGWWKEKYLLSTDSDGRFERQGRLDRDYLVHVSKGNDALLDNQSHYAYEHGQEASNIQNIILTDRAIYRPGQTIQFKVIALRQDPRIDEYKVLPGQSLNVNLRDPNNQQVEQLQLKTNEFGSAHGSFTAPAGVVTGAFTIQSTFGSAVVRVEEYKRPKFLVELAKPATPPRVDDTVKLTGTARGYSGAPVDGAKVRWRVVRQIEMPWWCFWWYWRHPQPEAREIASGRLKTDEQGKFEIVFRAEPDRTVPEADNPTFTYRVEADVTDSTGETRSAKITTRVGYAALELAVNASDWLDSEQAVKLQITSRTLDGLDSPASGKVEIFRLQGPDKPVPAMLQSGHRYRWWADETADKTDPGDWRSWKAGESVIQKEFDTANKTGGQLEFRLAPGAYRAVVSSKDRFGRAVHAEKPLLVLNPTATTFPVTLPSHVQTKSASVEVGDSAEVLWGSGYSKAWCLVEVEHRHKILKRYWVKSATQHLLRYPVDESLRGGFTIHITHLQEYRSYQQSIRINVPWSDRVFQVSLETFRSRLQPGQEETWTLKIQGPGAEIRAAEVAAALYDESLDAFAPHSWNDLSNVFRQEHSGLGFHFANHAVSGQDWENDWNIRHHSSYWHYPGFPNQVTDNVLGYGYPEMMMECKSDSFGGAMPAAPPGARLNRSAPMPRKQAKTKKISSLEMDKESSSSAPQEEPAEDGAPAANDAAEPDLSKVSARTNLNETAFFFPQLTTDGEGQVSLTFTMPEALTRWKFLALAHGMQLESGLAEEHTVTQKDLMVEPNPPRFLREGDELEFPAKISNMSDKVLEGKARLTLKDAVTGEDVTSRLGITKTDLTFKLEPGRSESLFWKLSIADGLPPLTWRVVAGAGDKSDGEEAMLPVLSKRIQVIESLPLPIRGPATKDFSFKKLLDSGGSDTLQHLSLTVQVCSNPAWYAVQALPYLMEFPHECSEQIFSRYYANALARHIANSDPKIRRVFNLWKGTDALKSNLQKNEKLKSVLLQETPWVLQAKSEEQAKRNVGILFDGNRLDHELTKAMDQLVKRQMSDGGWPWFPGGRPDPYITLHIATGFARLRKLGVSLDVAPALKALGFIDTHIKKRYDDLKRLGYLGHMNLDSTIAYYLYGRSMFLDDRAIPGHCREAVDYFLGQAKEHWLKLERMGQGHLALALGRFSNRETPAKIVASLKERSKNEEEMGMYWAEGELALYWYRAPIETQALMVEVFQEVAEDNQAVEDLKVWLIKQKQTQDWKTTKATADAIYALLLRGTDLLSSDKLVSVTLAGVPVTPEKVEAGTGFYEQTWTETAVKPEMGQITLTKEDQGVAWGSIHWQYLEDMQKVTAHETNLSLKKALFVEKMTKAGPVIEPVQGSVTPGDRIVVRIELRSDRDLEYVHMRDHRGAGLEPEDVLSHYRYQDGLAYYQSTKDTATHFFIDYLPKGTYVFEYKLRVQHKGHYQTGMAFIQCMYAPEFNSHSESISITAE